MENFQNIKEALKYIDFHLDEPISFKSIAEKFNFSPYYFHRMFSVITDKTITAHIRDRRLQTACKALSETDRSILNIALDCGYNSAQSFSRVFKQIYGISPSEYRKQGYEPVIVTVDEMIMKFTNRLKGGIYVNPKIIKKEELIIAGISGAGDKTAEVWESFGRLKDEKPLNNNLSDNGYEIRIYDNGNSIVYVGLAVLNEQVSSDYEIMRIPASKYASFDVYVENGYDSENNAINEWLNTNSKGYTQKTLDGKYYCVEYYDERFNGNESGSIVEIWIPIEKV